MKLKTLKDREEKWINSNVSQPMKDAILQFNHELKAEAVKHIRIMFKFYHYDAGYSMMHFFNLTKEDLK